MKEGAGGEREDPQECDKGAGGGSEDLQGRDKGQEDTAVSGPIGVNVRNSNQWLEILPPSGWICYRWIAILLLVGNPTPCWKS